MAIGCESPTTEDRKSTTQDSRRPNSNAIDSVVDGTALDALFNQISSNGFRKIDSLLLLRDGELIFETYQNQYGPEKAHGIASITKSVTSLLIGIAIDRGHISSVEDKVVNYFANTPYENSWPADKQSITIEHLLTMQHGIACDDYGDPGMKQFRSWLNSDDRIAALLAMPMARPPGQESTYCTASTQLLQQVIETSTGQSVETFARRALFEPLGIKSFRWERSPKHGVGMGFGAKAHPRDIAVLGRLVELHGNWQGTQIVSSKWLEETFKRRGTLLEIDYGYLWYGEAYSINGETIQSHLAMGHGGQFLILFPQLQAILVIAASDYDQEIDFYDLVKNYVIPVISAADE